MWWRARQDRAGSGGCRQLPEAEHVKQTGCRLGWKVPKGYVQSEPGHTDPELVTWNLTQFCLQVWGKLEPVASIIAQHPTFSYLLAGQPSVSLIPKTRWCPKHHTIFCIIWRQNCYQPLCQGKLDKLFQQIIYRLEGQEDPGPDPGQLTRCSPSVRGPVWRSAFMGKVGEEGS